MTLAEIEEDLSRRDLLFSLEFSPEPDIGDNSQAWCGVSEAGPFERMLPVLFHESTGGPRASLDFVRDFSSGDDDQSRIKPIQYSNTGPTSWKADVTYVIKPVRVSSIDIDYVQGGDLRSVAQHWCDELAHSTASTTLTRIGGGDLRFQVRLRIYAQIFETVIPIFTEAPTQNDVEAVLDDVKIPCVTIVPDHTDYNTIIRKFPTRIEPGVTGGSYRP